MNKTPAIPNTREAINKSGSEIFYFEDTFNGTYRVWRKSWFGDQFEIVPKLVFEDFKILANRLIPNLVQEVYDE